MNRTSLPPRYPAPRELPVLHACINTRHSFCHTRRRGLCPPRATPHATTRTDVESRAVQAHMAPARPTSYAAEGPGNSRPGRFHLPTLSHVATPVEGRTWSRLSKCCHCSGGGGIGQSRRCVSCWQKVYCCPALLNLSHDSRSSRTQYPEQRCQDRLRRGRLRTNVHSASAWICSDPRQAEQQNKPQRDGGATIASQGC